MTFPLLNAAVTRDLSTDESAELAAGVAFLAKAGLPLEAGLRAMAGELPGRRLKGVLRQLAGRLSAGETLEAAIQAQGPRLPAHLRGLIVAGVRSGRLAGVLDDFVSLVGRQRELRHKIALSLAYPTMLMALMTLLMGFIHVSFVDDFDQLFRNFGVRLPLLTEVFLKGSWVIVAAMATVTFVLLLIPVLSFAAPRSTRLAALLAAMPIVGPNLRWCGLAQFSEMMAMLLEQQVPLPEALGLAADGLRDAGLATGCRNVAAQVHAGRPLAESLADDGHFPGSLTTLVQWGQRSANLVDAMRASAEAFEARARSQSVFLDVVVPPIAFLTIVAFAGFFVAAIIAPLVSLMSNLSGGY